MAHYDRIFKNGTIVNQDGTHRADLAVTDERIAAIGEVLIYLGIASLIASAIFALV